MDVSELNLGRKSRRDRGKQRNLRTMKSSNNEIFHNEADPRRENRGFRVRWLEESGLNDFIVDKLIKDNIFHTSSEISYLITC